jgi:hypothetical protein
VTIRKGRDWGERRPVPDPIVEVTSDAALADLVADAWQREAPPPPVALLGGDLYRTLGGTGDRRRLEGGQAMAFPLDVGLVQADDRAPVVFAAHVVARRPLWTGRFAVVMNAAWAAGWYLGPRAHPNDGLLDLTEGSLPLAQRVLARRRAPTGTHLPHPGLRTRRAARHELGFERATPVVIDGRHRGRGRRLVVECRPDAVTCWV